MEEDRCLFCDQPQGSRGQNFSGTCGSRQCERLADEAGEHQSEVERSDSRNSH